MDVTFDPFVHCVSNSGLLLHLLTLPAGRATLTGEELRKIAETELKILYHHHLMQLYLRASIPRRESEENSTNLSRTYHILLSLLYPMH